MMRFLLYACVWAPGFLAVTGFTIAMVISHRVEAGQLSWVEGYDAIFPWVWIPGFLLVPAAILGLALLLKARWIALLQLIASVGLVLGWGHFADSGLVLNQEVESKAVPGE